MVVQVVDKSNRAAKRHTMASLSPVMTTIGETVNGRALIHAMGLEDYYFDKQSRNVDTWNRYNHFSATALAWGMYTTSIISVFFATFAIVFVYMDRDSYKDVAFMQLL